MEVADLIDGDVERCALDAAQTAVLAAEVDDELALRGDGCGLDGCFVGSVLQGWCVAREGGVGGVYLGGETAEHTAMGEVLQGLYLRRNTIVFARLLEGVVGHEAARIDIGGVDGVVHVLLQAALAEGSVPDAQFIDPGILGILAHGEHGAFQWRHVGLGDDGCALPVEIEAGCLAAHHVQCQMTPVHDFGEVLDTGHHDGILVVVEDQVLLPVVVQTQLVVLLVVYVLVGCHRLEYHILAVIVADLMPQFYGIAVAGHGGDLCDVNLRTLVVVDAQAVVHVLKEPAVGNGEVVGVALVGCHEAVALVKGPVVGQPIDVAVLCLVLGGGGEVNVAIDVVEAERVDVGIDAAEVEVIVVGIAECLQVLHRYGAVLEQHHVAGLVCRRLHVEGHGAGLVAQCHEGPFVLGHGFVAHMLCPAHCCHDVAIVADIECKGRIRLAK